MFRSMQLVIHCQRRSSVTALLTLALLATIFLGYLALGQGMAAASAPQAPSAGSTGLRQFYLTKTTHDGIAADGEGVCAPGYHFASLWEILDTSGLQYNHALGLTWADFSLSGDMGEGPPSLMEGWVRTGSIAYTGDTDGAANCDAWNNDSGSAHGTSVYLDISWAAATNTFGWVSVTRACGIGYSVWCVADHVGSRLYLPLVVR